MSDGRLTGEILRNESVGGALLLMAAAVALIMANSPLDDVYRSLSEYRLGPATLHLDLSLAAWAADGLLAIFFFVAGLELKREFVIGELSDPRRALLPVAAAVGGMVVPAVLYTAVNLAEGGALRGWAIPTATDIAFALAVLAVVGRNLPASLRTFLLTLAVVDDLLAISIIAVFYTEALHPIPLLGALVPLAAFAFLVQRGHRRWWLLLPLAVVCWALVHASGIHATVAGVLLAATVPVRGAALAERFEHRWQPISAGVAAPVFAFFAAGVSLSGGVGAAIGDPVLIGVVIGLVVGKFVGVLGTTLLVQRFTRAALPDGIRRGDLVGLSLLAGIGFTVSLLITELAFGAGTAADDHARLGVLAGSLISAVLAAVVLGIRRSPRRTDSGPS